MRIITFKLELTGEEETNYRDTADWAIMEDYIDLRFNNDNISLKIVSDSDVITEIENTRGKVITEIISNDKERTEKT